MKATFTGAVRVALVVAAAIGLLARPSAAQGDTMSADTRADYGVSLAMAGSSAKAESIFVSMLSHARGDARALNNLGNLRLLRGELGVALAFYERASRGDSADAGIHLNRGTALMLMGDEARAREAAAKGVLLAGGLDKAQALLGIRSEREPGKAADQKAFVNKGEIRALLQSAAAAVPSDTGHVAGKAAVEGTGKKRAPTWRSAGPRSADQSDAAAVLYWKR
jgi:hypothetical protein